MRRLALSYAERLIWSVWLHRCDALPPDRLPFSPSSGTDRQREKAEPSSQKITECPPYIEDLGRASWTLVRSRSLRCSSARARSRAALEPVLFQRALTFFPLYDVPPTADAQPCSTLPGQAGSLCAGAPPICIHSVKKTLQRARPGGRLSAAAPPLPVSVAPLISFLHHFLLKEHARAFFRAVAALYPCSHCRPDFHESVSLDPPRC